MKLLFRTDIHVADKSPGSWKADYRAETLSCLKQIGDIARKHRVTAVLDGGDFFHVKAASRTSHELVRQVVEIHKTAYHCPVYHVEGNHDVQANNLETCGRQPLGVLYAAGVFERLRDTTLTDEDGGTVRVVGLPFDIDRKVEDFYVEKGSEDHLVVIAHTLASDTDREAPDFFGEPIFSYSDLEGADADVFCFGHWHKDQGIVNSRFVNTGSVSRGALNHDNVGRTPKVVLMEFGESVTLTEIPLQVKPADEIFDFDRKERQEEQDRSIEEFVQKIRADVSLGGDPKEVVDGAIEGMGYAPEVQELARQYLARARES